MKFVLYEIRKLISTRYIIYSAVLLLLCSGAVCFYQIRNDYDAMARVYADQLFRTYSESPDELTREYEDVTEYNRERQRIAREQMAAGNYSYVSEPLPNKYAPDGYTDSQLFALLFDRVDYAAGYPDRIGKVIRTAVTNLSEYDRRGISADSYAYRYQISVVNIYDRMLGNVTLEPENARGWDEFFEYDISNIFIFILVIIVSSTTMIQERGSGFLAIILMSKNGRGKTAAAKIAAVVIIDIVIVLAFSIVNFCIIGAVAGYSSPDSPLATFERFVLCRYKITVGEYLVISLCARSFAMCVFSLAVMAISVLISQYAVVYISSLVFLGINFALYMTGRIFGESAASLFNLFSLSAVYPLFVRFRAVNIFGSVVDCIPFIAVTGGAIFILASALVIYKFGARNVLPRAIAGRGLRSVLPRLPVGTASKPRAIGIKPLALYEFYKLIFTSRYYIPIILLLVIKCRIDALELAPDESYADAIYKEYMTALAGEYTDDKRQYIKDERERINSILAEYENNQHAYMKGELSLDEYNGYMKDYSRAYSRDGYFAIIEAHAGYIDRLNLSGRDAWFVYDTGWKKLFFAEFDYTLYFVLLLVFSNSFAMEYTKSTSSGGMASLIRTTRRGRLHTFAAKYGIALLLTCALYIIWCGVDIAYLAHAYLLPLADAPAASIESLEGISVELSIQGYLAAYYLVRLAALLILSIALCSLSGRLRRNLTVISAVVVPTLLPALCVYFGLPALVAVDYTAFARATPVLLGDMASWFVPLCVVVCAVLAVLAERSWDAR